VWTVEQWLAHWLDDLVAPFVRENTLPGYRVAVRAYLVPSVGAHRLGRLEPNTWPCSGHRAEQDREREQAAQLWHKGGWVTDRELDDRDDGVAGARRPA
jgi:hypothetical protein